jgi:spore coat protein U-like protein
MKRALAVAAVGAVALILVPAVADAQTRTTTFDVSATVARNCLISATNLAFGNYDPVEAHATNPLDGTSTISVACTRGSSNVWVGLNLGANASGSTRQMISSGNYLQYELYVDNTYTPVWGSTQVAGNTWPVFPSRAPVTRTVYGRIPGGQDVPAGSYADTITATVNF